jgi:O-acetylhomoserine/O-acetylserine sulfhydrylase-like pyridoxal-dependent enzyme
LLLINNKKMNNEELSFTGKILHTPYAKPDAYGALSMPVYQCAAFEFETAEMMEAAFMGKVAEHTYALQIPRCSISKAVYKI